MTITTTSVKIDGFFFNFQDKGTWPPTEGNCTHLTISLIFTMVTAYFYAGGYAATLLLLFRLM